MKENLLSIDIGTQSVRALLFDPRGNMLAKARVLIEPYFSTAPGLAEQHTQVFWDALCQSCQELWAEPGAQRESIAAVSLTTQRGSVVCVGRDNKPLRPAILWLDQRRTEGLPPIGGLWGLAFRLAGVSDTIAHLQAEAEVNWIRTHEPQTWAAIHKFMLLSSYITFCLTDCMCDSIGCQVGYLPFDYKHQTWSRSYDWKWQAAQVDPSWLVELLPQTQTLGYITRRTSEQSGIPEGLPLIAGAADKACEVLGSGGLEPHIGCLSYGTTATINTNHHRYVEIVPQLPPYPSAVPGDYNLEMQVYRGFWMVSWFKQEFGLREERLAQESGIEPEELFDELLKTTPPGSEGLFLQPYWSPGLRKPGPEARGAIIGFSDVHTRAHIYRAMLEGLGYALREGVEATNQRTGAKISELRVAGGGSQSNAAMQLTADLFGLPASRPHVYEASGLGAAIVASVGAKIHPDFSSAVSEMTRIRDTFEPDPQASRFYDELYHLVYSQMYSRLRPLYMKIRSVKKK